MNKQEAIEIIEQSKTKIARSVDSICEKGIFKVRHEWADYVPLEVVVNTIDKIGPQKVVVPKFVADYIEYCKHEKFYALHGAYDKMDGRLKRWRFKGSNSELFAKAWLFGYEIEQEKLYTVEIPNPNATHDDVYILGRNLSGSVSIWRGIGDIRDYDSNFKLTEAEIKEDFEWAWQWAKPVEV